MDHYISVVERIISIDTGDIIIQNGIESDSIVVTKDSEWSGMTSIVVVFENGENVYNQVLDTNSKAVVPWEVLQESGDLYITVIGYVNDEARVVTKRMDSPFKVLVSGTLDGEMSVPPTPDQITQAVNVANQALSEAQSLETQLESLISGLTFPIPVSNGGTGATTASAALNNLGITWGTSAAPSSGTPNTIYIQLL